MVKKDSQQIYKRQNEKGMINHLKAQKHVYKSAKRWIVVLFFCLIIVPLAISIVSNFIENDTILATLMGAVILLTLLGQLIRMLISSKKFLAAGIQQRFDEYVLGVDGSSIRYYMLGKPDRTDVIRAMQKYENKGEEKLLNWYSDYSNLPYEQAVMFCQKNAVSWAYSQKKAYRIFLICGIALLLVGITVNSIINAHLMSRFILILLTALPLISYLLGGLIKMTRDIKIQSKMLSKMSEVEEKLAEFACEDLIDITNEFQAEIYRYRQKAYMVPEWFYKIAREHNQKTEDAVAKEISDQCKQMEEDGEDE